jgi:hypothetical protein
MAGWSPNMFRRESVKKPEPSPPGRFSHTRRADARRSWSNVGLCIAKIVLSPADVRAATKSGGRKPPVAPINAVATAIHARAPTHTVGDLPTNDAPVRRYAFARPRRVDARGAGRKRSQLQLRYSHPRRADARRSCERAFVHRECRYISADPHRATRAAGVSQPWKNFRHGRVVSQHVPA